MSEHDPVAEVVRLLRASTGLTPESIGTPAIQRAVRDRMTACGATDLETYLVRLRRDSDELQALIEQVVVPETWFFRYPDAFQALGDIVATRWMRTHTNGILRVLSAPCSTGEEAYSIAIALRNLEVGNDRIRIDAIDVSRAAVECGRRATYGPHSFRTSDLGFRDRCCARTAAGYVVAPEIRATVRFEHGNLVAPDFRPPAPAYEIIFCRNLLIYLDRPTQARVLAMWRALLAPGGYLFLGPAESVLAAEHGFTNAGYRMAFAHQAAPPRVPPRAALRPPERGNRRRQPTKAREEIAPPPASPAPRSPVHLAAVSALADAGRLDDAATACEQLIRERGASAPSYYLLGLVRDALGHAESAADCYRKALFLDPDHHEAAAHLAWLAEKQHDATSARRLRARAQRVAGRSPVEGD